jgi:hypothetical protein
MREKQDILINLLDFNKTKQNEIVKEFLAFLKENPDIDINKKGAKGYFEGWLYEKGYDDSNISKALIDDLWNRIKFRALSQVI